MESEELTISRFGMVLTVRYLKIADNEIEWL